MNNLLNTITQAVAGGLDGVHGDIQVIRSATNQITLFDQRNYDYAQVVISAGDFHFVTKLADEVGSGWKEVARFAMAEPDSLDSLLGVVVSWARRND